MIGVKIRPSVILMTESGDTQVLFFIFKNCIALIDMLHGKILKKSIACNRHW